MDIEALTLLANPETYDKYYSVINDNRMFFVEPAQQAIRHLPEYKQMKQGEVNWGSYKQWLYMTKLPSIGDEDRAVFDVFFNELQYHEPDEAVQKNIISTLMERKTAEKGIEMLEDISTGSSRYSLEDIRKLLEEYDEGVGAAEGETNIVSSDLDELLGAVLGDGLDWKQIWMNKSCGPLRLGDFVALVARSDTGKTSFLSGQANHFAKQTDKPVLWINNEQEGRKVKLRIVQEAVGMSNVDMNLHKDKTRQKYQEVVGDMDKVIVVDDSTITTTQIEKLCKKHQPAVVIIDQLWSIGGMGHRDEMSTQSALAKWARTLAKTQAPVIGVYQADGEADGMKYFGMKNIHMSKVAVQGEADLIICMGRSNAENEANVRFFNFPKNKMAGGGPYFDERCRNQKHESIFNPETGVFK